MNNYIIVSRSYNHFSSTLFMLKESFMEAAFTFLCKLPQRRKNRHIEARNSFSCKGFTFYVKEIVTMYCNYSKPMQMML